MSIASDWVVACETAIVDRLTRKVSLVHVVEHRQVDAFPAELSPFQIVALWHNRTDMAVSATLAIEVHDAQGEAVTCLVEEDVVFTGRVSHRTICIVHAMTVERPGAYRLVARWQEGGGLWHLGAAHPFTVAATPQPQLAAQA